MARAPSRADRCDRGPVSRPSGGPAGRRGASLVEAVVALLLLSAGALALAGAITHGLRERHRGFEEAAALAAAESWLEGWRARPWAAFGGAGTGPVSWGTGQGRIDWATWLLTPCLAEARVRVTPGRSGAARARPAALVSRRFREGVAGCRL